MAGPPPTPLRRLWYRWKALSLPWRRQRLCGYDLSGTTFWEFRDALTAGRMRRIAKYPRKTHYSEVEIPPSWLQWLRHTRDAPPSFEEQIADVDRRARMRELARRADERWEGVERFADKPQGTALKEGVGAGEGAGRVQGVEMGVGRGEVVGDGRRGGEDAVVKEEVDEVEGRTTRTESKENAKSNVEKEDNPWNRQKRSNPGDEWQPEAWQPSKGR